MTGEGLKALDVLGEYAQRVEGVIEKLLLEQKRLADRLAELSEKNEGGEKDEEGV